MTHRREYSGRTGDSVDHDTQHLRFYDMRYANGSFALQSGLEINGTLVVSKRRNWSCPVVVDKRALFLISDGGECEIEHNKTVELGGEKGKWEGDVCDGKPCGWGIQYDKDGNMIYEGFRVEDVNVCYGTRYYPENHQIAYVGNWHMGKRWGRGVQYDRVGKVVYEGDWMNDNPMEKRVEVADEKESSITYHSGIEELIIHEYAFCDRHMKTLDLGFFFSLRVLEIEADCFSNVETTHIEGLDRLETVRIGSSCFVVGDDWGEGKGKSYLRDCPVLKEFVVGTKSFQNCTVCEMRNLPCLETISIGTVEEEESSCFWYSSLVLRGGRRGRE